MARVLIVEDQIDHALPLASLLRRGGHAVETVFDGRGAMAALGNQAAHGDMFSDAIILDIHMPGMDGFEFLRAARADPRWRLVPVVVLTGVDDPAQLDRLLPFGVHRVFRKGSTKLSDVVDCIGKIYQ
jgi:adenylate cyclase